VRGRRTAGACKIDRCIQSGAASVVMKAASTDRGGTIACIARLVALAALLPAVEAARADSRTEFWPEVDGFFKLDERTRLFLMATLTHAKESGTPEAPTAYQDAQFGANLDITLQPIARPTLREGDWERNRYWWVRVGYRYARSIGDTDEGEDAFRENRLLLETTLRQPLPGEWWLVPRLRWDLRDVNGTNSQRYRVRLGIEREFQLGERAWVPYANAETFYDTRFDTWNRQRYQMGVEVELSEHWRIEPYLAYQNDSRSQPEHITAFGLVLKYYH
jgi:hypothetical protein